MKRIYPRRIHDKFYLSQLLEQYLHTLEHSPMQITLRALSYDAQIPESILTRLAGLHRNPEDAPHIEVSDFHIVFSKLLFRYPTVKIWAQGNAGFFFEM